MDPVERLYLDVLAEAASGAPAGGRSRLLTAAAARRRPADTVPRYGLPYAGRVAAMDAVLASASAADWSRVVVEGWTLQELVAHLAAKDGLVAEAVGAPVAGPPVGARDALGRTAELQEFERGRSPEETRRDWRAQADALCRHLAVVGPEHPVDWDGLPMPVSDHLLARMLETWIHADDAARMLGLRLPPPVPEHVRPAADLCARLLPWTFAVSGGRAGDRSVRLVLTGPGGGEWHVPLDPARPVRPAAGEEADAEITCEVADFCFLLGRHDGPRPEAALAGDTELALEVLAAAPALSGP